MNKNIISILSCMLLLLLCRLHAADKADNFLEVTQKATPKHYKLYIAVTKQNELFLAIDKSTYQDSQEQIIPSTPDAEVQLFTNSLSWDITKTYLQRPKTIIITSGLIGVRLLGTTLFRNLSFQDLHSKEVNRSLNSIKAVYHPQTCVASVSPGTDRVAQILDLCVSVDTTELTSVINARRPTSHHLQKN